MITIKNKYFFQKLNIIILVFSNNVNSMALHDFFAVYVVICVHKILILSAAINSKMKTRMKTKNLKRKFFGKKKFSLTFVG